MKGPLQDEMCLCLRRCCKNQIRKRATRTVRTRIEERNIENEFEKGSERDERGWMSLTTEIGVRNVNVAVGERHPSAAAATSSAKSCEKTEDDGGSLYSAVIRLLTSPRAGLQPPRGKACVPVIAGNNAREWESVFPRDIRRGGGIQS